MALTKTPNVSHIKIESYKCYSELDLDLRPGVNVIIGQNNAGKTALLEVLSLGFTSIPHRPRHPGPDDATPPESRATISVTINDFDLFRSLAPWPHDIQQPTPAFCSQNGFADNQAFISWLSSQRTHMFIGLLGANGTWSNSFLPSLDTYPVERGLKEEFTCIEWQDRDGKIVATGSSRRLRPTADFGLEQVLKPLHSTTFYFQPDRMLPQRSRLAPDGQLLPNGENLAGVLQKLQSEFRLDEYMGVVQCVFPNLRHITSAPVDPQTVETRIWTLATDLRRPDLGIPLGQSGRGLAPVLAILYVLFTAQSPCRIIVDEPQSFLHPGALRRLLDLFRRYPEHQFILATHSPLVVAAATVEYCIVVRQEDGHTTAEQIDARSVASARRLLIEVGASLQDVFGADQVLWVEGPTEVHCFTRILQQHLDLQLKGTVILPLRGTDDLKGRHARLAITVYDRLCQANALLPPALAFELDREQRSLSDRQELTKRTNGRVFFTKRCMYENYLLSPEALAAVLCDIPNFRDPPVTAEEIRAWLAARRKGEDKDSWLVKVDAAKLLDRLFKEFSDRRYVYCKTTHGVQLTDWLLEHAPTELDELAQLLTQMLKSSVPA